MKNKLMKVLAGLIIGVGLSGIEVSSASVEPGWHKHCQTSVNGYSWEYVNPDGSFASGWKYIDGYSYYFDEFDDYEQIFPFTGSQYVQSVVGESYRNG